MLVLGVIALISAFVTTVMARLGKCSWLYPIGLLPGGLILSRVGYGIVGYYKTRVSSKTLSLPSQTT